jgi:hypothetical protein
MVSAEPRPLPRYWSSSAFRFGARPASCARSRQSTAAPRTIQMASATRSKAASHYWSRCDSIRWSPLQCVCGTRTMCRSAFLRKTYRAVLRPFRSGIGGEDPFTGTTKNSAIGTDSVVAKRSRTSTVGFSSQRSRPPTYERSTPASKASLSCERPRSTLTRRKFHATKARPSIAEGGHGSAYKTTGYRHTIRETVIRSTAC